MLEFGFWYIVVGLLMTFLFALAQKEGTGYHADGVGWGLTILFWPVVVLLFIYYVTSKTIRKVRQK